MNISLGVVEWEEQRRSAPSTLGKKLAVTLCALTLAALAMGSWLEAHELKGMNDSAPAIVEVAGHQLVRVESPARAGNQVLAR